MIQVAGSRRPVDHRLRPGRPPDAAGQPGPGPDRDRQRRSAGSRRTATARPTRSRSTRSSPSRSAGRSRSATPTARSSRPPPGRVASRSSPGTASTAAPGRRRHVHLDRPRRRTPGRTARRPAPAASSSTRRAPSITSISPDGSVVDQFSPNGDGVADTITTTATPTEAGSIAVRVADDGNTTVRTFVVRLDRRRGRRSRGTARPTAARSCRTASTRSRWPPATASGTAGPGRRGRSAS